MGTVDTPVKDVSGVAEPDETVTVVAPPAT